MQCCAKIRYRQADQDCYVSEAADGALLVRFDQPQRAITPGQHIAFYRGEQMLGGATISIAGPTSPNNRALCEQRYD
jgi:tRNA-specific 2-thiouridylase